MVTDEELLKASHDRPLWYVSTHTTLYKVVKAFTQKKDAKGAFSACLKAGEIVLRINPVWNNNTYTIPLGKKSTRIYTSCWLARREIIKRKAKPTK